MKTAITLLLTLALPLAAQTKPKMDPSKQSPKKSMKTSAKTSPAAVHASAIVIDTHADTPQRFVDENFDLAGPLNGGNLNFDSARQGNLGAQFFSIWVEPELFKGQYSRRTLDLIDSVYQQAARHPDKMTMAYSAADIERAHSQHKLAALMGIEGGHSIENSLGLLRDYYRLGVRYMTLTWSNSLDWADSSGDATDTSIPHPAVSNGNAGLTEFGKDVVFEMNRLGMMVDISHVSDKTFFRTLVISRAPVIASHSCARALNDAPRNMTDDMLRAVASGPRGGGVIQVNYYSGFLSQDYRNAAQAQAAEVKAAKKAFTDKARAEGRQPVYGDMEKIERQYADRIPRPPFSALIDNIDHIAKVAGIDHVGLGSDFDGVSFQLPQGIDSAADLPKITEALIARGYSPADCRKILGGNLLRVFRAVEATAKELQAPGMPTTRPRITEQVLQK